MLPCWAGTRPQAPTCAAAVRLPTCIPLSPAAMAAPASQLLCSPVWVVDVESQGSLKGLVLSRPARQSICAQYLSPVPNLSMAAHCHVTHVHMPRSGSSPAAIRGKARPQLSSPSIYCACPSILPAMLCCLVLLWPGSQPRPHGRTRNACSFTLLRWVSAGFLKVPLS